MDGHHKEFDGSRMDEQSVKHIAVGSGESDEAPDGLPEATPSSLAARRSSNTGRDATNDHVVDRHCLVDSSPPDEVCAEFERLHHALRAREAESGDADASEIADHIDQLFADVATLPRRDVERARDVYAALAKSECREFAATLMPKLAEADPTFALPIWQELLGDENSVVRSLAYDALKSSAQQGLGPCFSYEQIFQLFDSLLAAERNESTRGTRPSGTSAEE
jgi:hypothetical protein